MRVPNNISPKDVNKLDSFVRLTVSVFISENRNERFSSVWNSMYREKMKHIKSSNLADKTTSMELLEEVSNYIKNITTIKHGHTLVMFINEEDFNVLEIPAKLDNEIIISNLPHLSPVSNFLEEDGRMLIISLERNSALIYSIDLLRFDKMIAVIKSEVPQKIKGMSESWKGLRETKNQRHIEWHLREHLKKVYNKFKKVYQTNNYEGVCIGGHNELVSKFVDLLNKREKKIIRGIFYAESDILLNKVKSDGFKAIDDILRS